MLKSILYPVVAIACFTNTVARAAVTDYANVPVTVPVTPNVSFSQSNNPIEMLTNQSVALTADRATTWSLAPGSVGTITRQSGSSVIYTAPSSVQPQNAVAGCMVLPNDAVFNVPIDGLPVHASSAAWIQQTQSIASVGISFGASWGVNVIDNDLAPTTMTFHYSTQRDGTQFQIPAGNDRSRETGALTTDGSNDHHLISINRQTCHVYETYQDNLTGAPSGVGYAASGWSYASNTYLQPSSTDGGGTTDAAGLPLLPLTLHLSEIEAGSVNHALRFSSCAGCINSAHLWPAVGSTAGTITAAPMGSRWRLKSSFNIGIFSSNAQIILTGLKTYGMFLADIGGINQIQVDNDVNQDFAITAALSEIQVAHIDAANFEIVDESSLMGSADSSQINLNNSYVRPKTYAALTGTDGSGNTVTVPLVLRPVLVSTPHEWLTIQAGNSFQLASWVNGSLNQAVTWTLTSGPGYITSEGMYTPPNTVAAPTAFILTATAQADTNATVTVRGNVIPSGVIRLDVGSSSSYQDTAGNIWLADTLGVTAGSFMNDNSNYPPVLWKKLKDWQLYSTYKYTWGDDISYLFVVPNGNYEIGFVIAKADCVGTYDPTAEFDNGLVAGGTVGLEAQGQVTMFNVAAHNSSTCRVPVTGKIKTTVTDQVLRVALRATGGNEAHQIALLNGLTITPQP